MYLLRFEMFICSPQIKRFLYTLALLSLCLFLNPSCKPTTASIGNSDKFYKYTLKEAKFDLGDEDKFDFSIVAYTTDRNNRILIQYKKKTISDEKDLGLFLKLSGDGGKSFGKEYEISELIRSDSDFDSYAFYFVPNGFAATIVGSSNFFYTQSIGTLDNWSEPIQVNDEQNSLYSGIQLLQESEKEAHIVWVDKRRGFNLMFFASTIDGGKNWSANQAIDYDFREGSQEFGKIIKGENGRLHVFWQDWRDSKTLVDIRYSYSDDKGVNWSESIKINDDEKEVWQINPIVVADGANIYVAFTDFREKGVDDDNDWNIYFARSIDNGATWDNNKRLNEIKEGIDGIPILSIDEAGNLFCLWESGRETLFGQIVYSYSKDKGETWSPSSSLTKKDELAIAELTAIAPLSRDTLLVRLGLEKLGKQDINYYYLEKTNELYESGNDQKIENNESRIEPIKYEIGDILFEDDFSNNTSEKWDARSGVWDIVDGTYMGVYPNQYKQFASNAKFQEPANYVLQGRFRLDSVAHTTAILKFRVNESTGKEYVLVNRFRIGTWLSLKEFEVDQSFGGNHLTGGTPLVQEKFPFRQDRWYHFDLVVTPNQVDYYVEGNLMLSYKGDLALPIGKIGIGGHTSSPTYFDDIKVLELK